MPAQKSSVSSLFGAVVGTLGFSALAGVLVTVMVAPAIAVTGITANNTIGIFESLPDYIELERRAPAEHDRRHRTADGTESSRSRRSSTRTAKRSSSTR